jgi:hypothetical protein
MSDYLSKEIAKPANRKGLMGLIVQGITTGKIHFPGEDKPSTLGLRDWLMLVEFFYKQTEGAPSADIDLVGDVRILVDYADDPYSLRQTPPGAIDGDTEPQAV